MRTLTLLGSLASLALLVALTALPTAAKPPRANGKIVTGVEGESLVYTVDPDGTDQQVVAVDSETGQWAPDGSVISLFDRLLNPNDGSVINLNLSAQYPDLFLPCGVWSPDGARLACEGGFIDPS